MVRKRVVSAAHEKCRCFHIQLGLVFLGGGPLVGLTSVQQQQKATEQVPKTT